MIVVRVLVVLLAVLVPAFVQAQGEFPMPERLATEGFREVLAVAGNLYISGQPDSASFVRLKGEGVGTVINLRTAREMANRAFVPFDEKQLVEELGMRYVHIPLGGEDTPYTPEAVRKFADAFDGAEGKVLLHCTVAWRASHMLAAYLVRYRGLSPAQAIARAKVINFGDLPVEGLLGREMLIDFR